MTEKFSIIIPHYNSPHTLKRLLASIPNDDFFSIVVVDDRSTKDIEVLRELIIDDGRAILMINNRINKGAGAARNIGLDYAQANLKPEWIMFADADDYFLSGLME